jgi:hypothetical protein
MSNKAPQSSEDKLSPREKQLVKKLVDYARNRVKKGIFLKKGTHSRYMNYLRSRTFDGPTEKHHIIPKHDGGSDEPSNLIVIGKHEHILAHLLLYLENGDHNDLVAYSFRRYSKYVDLTSVTQKARMIDKVLGLGFFNSEFQSTQGKKGGKKGGSANTAQQSEARSKVGSKYGRIVGISNQSSDLEERLTYYHVWQHKNLPDVQISTAPAPAALDIIRELILKCQELSVPQDLIPVFSKAAGGGYYYSFMRGGKASYYGWTVKLIPPNLVDEILDD